jgi:hypothetical protein
MRWGSGVADATKGFTRQLVEYIMRSLGLRIGIGFGRSCFGGNSGLNGDGKGLGVGVGSMIVFFFFDADLELKNMALVKKLNS